MKLASFEIAIEISRDTEGHVPRELIDALRDYSTRNPWYIAKGICYVVSKSRLDELLRLANSAQLTNAMKEIQDLEANQ